MTPTAKARLTLIALVALILVQGCATSGGVTLPPLPVWQTPAGATMVSGAAVTLSARARFPGVPINGADSSYILVSRDWLDRYVDWTWQAAKAAGVTYMAESFDCDDFAVGFSFFASRAAAKAGIRAAPLVARVVVALPAGRHELIGVVTDRGLVIVEPQPDAGPFRVTPIDQYTGRVLSITFGDFNP